MKLAFVIAALLATAASAEPGDYAKFRQEVIEAQTPKPEPIAVITPSSTQESLNGLLGGCHAIVFMNLYPMTQCTITAKHIDISKLTNDEYDIEHTYSTALIFFDKTGPLMVSLNTDPYEADIMISAIETKYQKGYHDEYAPIKANPARSLDTRYRNDMVQYHTEIWALPTGMLTVENYGDKNSHNPASISWLSASMMDKAPH